MKSPFWTSSIPLDRRSTGKSRRQFFYYFHLFFSLFGSLEGQKQKTFPSSLTDRPLWSGPFWACWYSPGGTRAYTQAPMIGNRHSWEQLTLGFLCPVLAHRDRLPMAIGEKGAGGGERQGASFSTHPRHPTQDSDGTKEK